MYEIAERHRLLVMNVFHAGAGNLHPLLVFDRREAGVMERVLDAGREITTACVAAGGVLSGEHGIGLEKRDHMPLIFSADDLDPQARLREAFDPDGVANPAAAATPSRCPRARGSDGRPVNALDLRPFADEVGPPEAGPVTCVGGRTQWDVGGPLDAGAREVKAPAGIVEHHPTQMVVRCGAGTTVAELDAALAASATPGSARSTPPPSG